MSDQQDRLALIARAGKRLRDSGGELEKREPVLADRPSLRERDQDNGQVVLRSPLTNGEISEVKQSSPETGPAAPFPVRLAFPRLRREGMLTPDNMTSGIGFEFRSIKRKLLSSVRSAQKQGHPGNLVVVTSPRPGDGKTFTSINLAVGLATERDVNVLLVDADIVRQKLTALFEPSKGLGLMDVIKDQRTDIAAVTHRCTDLPNLSVVFSGPHDDRTPELLASRRMGEICDEISRRYGDGIVIFDTPPVLASPETVSIAAFAHQIVMVVASGQTRRSQLQQALDDVAVCPNLSLLLNKAPEWNSVQGDTYYYYGYDERDRSDGIEQTKAVLRP
jgi:protein-tyrosine kinase